jgi:hypothetical protein
MTDISSPVDSQVDSELGKEKEEMQEPPSKEEDHTIREPIRSPRDNNFLQPPLIQTRSHSSTRSARSYTDGYSHFEHEHDDEEKGSQQTKPKEQGQEGKEFEVTFDGDSDPWNPRNKTTLRKWVIVLIGSACSLCVTCASALYTSTYDQMMVDYHISRLVATVGLTTYVCGLGLGPMVLAPLSEFYGRRMIYICAFGMFFIWMIPCAVAPNIGSMLVFRFIDGLAGSAFLSVAGGTVGDMFPKDKLSAPMMIYTASPFVGPEVVRQKNRHKTSRCLRL